MINFFSELSPIYQALVGGLFTFLITALGASLVFFFKEIKGKFLDYTISIASGIMLPSLTV